MEPEDAAGIALPAPSDWPGFIRRHTALAPSFDEARFPVALADALRAEPELIRRWKSCGWSRAPET